MRDSIDPRIPRGVGVAPLAAADRHVVGVTRGGEIEQVSQQHHAGPPGVCRDRTAANRASGVIGSELMYTPSGRSASATALASAGGVLMQFPSPTPLAPSSVTGDGVSRWSITSRGDSVAVGHR